MPSKPPAGDEEITNPEQRRRVVDRAADEEPTRVRDPGSAQVVASDEAAPGSTPRRPCLLVLAGPRVGELIAVVGHLVIGRDGEAGLQVLDEGMSRRHVRVSAGGGQVRLDDLDSTNGTWLAGQRVTSHILREGDTFRVGQTTVIKFTWQDPAEEQYQRQLLNTALRDTLTRAFNEHYFRERLDVEAAYSVRHGFPISVLVANVDRFDHVNRRYGQAAGDQILRQLADVMHGVIRADDVLARLGGDSFALIGRATAFEGGVRLAERLRGSVASALFLVSDETVEIRISLGVAATSTSLDGSAAGLRHAATAALSRAKLGGRNRVEADESARGELANDLKPVDASHTP